MADLINPQSMLTDTTTPWTSFINNQKNASATAFNGNESNKDPLSDFGSAISGSTNSSATGNFNPQAGQPTPSSTSSTPTSTSTGQTNSAVGNTTNQGTSTVQGIQQQNQQLLNKPSEPTNQIQSGTGLSSFGNIISSLGGQASKAISSFTGAGSSAINSLNDFGASIGFGGVPAETFGPSAVGSSAEAFGPAAGEAFGPAYGGAAADANAITSTSLSGVLGGAGIGAGIGSIYGSLTGLQGSNTTNAEIGGGIGGAIGSAILPGIGTALGSIGGSVIGGLFGPDSAPTSADSYYGKLTPSGGLNPDTVGGGSKNPGSVTGFGQKSVGAFNTLATSAASTLGFQFNPNISIDAAISTLHPGPGGTAALEVDTVNGGGNYDSGKIFFNPNDATSASNAYYKALTDAAAQSGYTDTQSLYNWYYGQGTLSNSTTSAFNNNVNIAPKGNYAAPTSITA